MLNRLLSLSMAFYFFITVAYAEVGPKPLPTGTVTINNHIFLVEIADNDMARAQGLSGRPALGENAGMYFIFPTARELSFWMKEMRFALDMVWIKDNKVVAITPNIPPPSPETPLNDLPRYSPPQPADAVLELAAGKADTYSIQSGSQVILRR